MCLAAIYWARLPAVYYANTRRDAARVQFDDAWLYREVAKPIARRKIRMRQLLRAEALEVFSEWQAKSDKILY
jgi:tRNA(Arg) A34 adenosine deaminase TadA